MDWPDAVVACEDVTCERLVTCEEVWISLAVWSIARTWIQLGCGSCG